METKNINKGTNEFQNIIKSYFLECMDFENRDIEPITEKEKFNAIYSIFQDEQIKNHKEWLKYYGSEQNAFKDWLQGLPSALNIDFENYKILELVKKWGFTADTTAKENKILNNHLRFMTTHFFRILQKLNK